MTKLELIRHSLMEARNGDADVLHQALIEIVDELKRIEVEVRLVQHTQREMASDFRKNL